MSEWHERVGQLVWKKFLFCVDILNIYFNFLKFILILKFYYFYLSIYYF